MENILFLILALVLVGVLCWNYFARLRAHLARREDMRAVVREQMRAGRRAWVMAFYQHRRADFSRRDRERIETWLKDGAPSCNSPKK